MKILWFTWKDSGHPQKGGAEKLNEFIFKKLSADGHKLKIITASYQSATVYEKNQFYEIYRVGRGIFLYPQSYLYFHKYLKDWPDLIVEEINTIPFFTPLYSQKKKVIIIYQLCQKIWFYQMFFPLNLLGFLLEPIYLKIFKKQKIITISTSTKKDLLKLGFKKENINVIPVKIRAVRSKEVSKNKHFTLLSLASARPMKRIHHVILAYQHLKKIIPDLQLYLVGNYQSLYGKLLKIFCQNNPHIQIFEGLKDQEIASVISRTHLIVSTAVKEGWGLTINEAALHKIPAVVYNVDGLRDNVIDQKTGLICQVNKPQELAAKIYFLYKHKKFYKKMTQFCQKKSVSYTTDTCYQQFKKILHG